jgi:hypothetical protein
MDSIQPSSKKGTFDNLQFISVDKKVMLAFAGHLGSIIDVEVGTKRF